MTDLESIIVSLQNNVATITLNDEATLNALSEEMLIAFIKILNDIEGNQDIKVIIITGAGRGFCSGANLTSDMLDSKKEVAADWLDETLSPLITTIRSIRKPIIAAVKGPAAGAGFSLALACDFILAGKSAKFVLSFAKIGLALDMGSSWTLLRAVGSLRANTLAMLAQPLDGETAKKWGIVFDTYEDDELISQAKKLAERLIAGSSAPALGFIKEQFNRATTSSLIEALSFEAKAQGELILTEETQTLIEAFRNK